MPSHYVYYLTIPPPVIYVLRTYQIRGMANKPGTAVVIKRFLQFLTKLANKARKHIPRPQKHWMTKPATVRCSAGNNSQANTKPGSTMP